MRRIIWRNFLRTEHDDFVLRVQPYMDETEEALPLYDEATKELAGWRIQTRYS